MPRPKTTACSREGRGRPGSSPPCGGSAAGQGGGASQSGELAAGSRRLGRPQRSPPHAPSPGAGIPAGAGAEGRPPSPCSSAVRRIRIFPELQVAQSGLKVS